MAKKANKFISIEGSVLGKASIDSNIIIEKKKKVALELAQSHSYVAPDLEEIYYLTSDSEADPTEPVKLLEISSSTIESGISPLYFTASHDISFPSIVVEISPNELKELMNHKKELPNGWKIGNRIFKKVA